VAFTRFKFDDNRPYVFKTADFGRSWSRLDAGLPALPVRVVREDPSRAGLLYLGNETGVWLSADDGRRWRPAAAQPAARAVTDLRVTRDGDLVAGHRRAGLLDLGRPLAAPAAGRRRRPGHVARAGDAADAALGRALRLAGGNPPSAGLPAGQNPPGGATLDYWLPAAPDSARPPRIEVVAAGGEVLRRYPAPADRVAPPPPGQPAAPPAFAPAAGHNRLTWDLRTEGARRVPGLLYDGPTAGWVVPPAGTRCA
jgi:hypothetical protein